MNLLVYPETPGSRILFIAAFYLTHEGLDASVDHFMCLHVPLSDEPQVALRALEGPFACVTPDMRLQVTCLAELL